MNQTLEIAAREVRTRQAELSAVVTSRDATIAELDALSQAIHAAQERLHSAQRGLLELATQGDAK